MIRKTKECHAPSGRPNIMYDIPSLYGTRDYLQPVPVQEIQAFEAECTFRNASPVDADVENLCFEIMRTNRITIPKESSGAKGLYTFLRRQIIQRMVNHN